MNKKQTHLDSATISRGVRFEGSEGFEFDVVMVIAGLSWDGRAKGPVTATL
jgi:hypothetical protein